MATLGAVHVKTLPKRLLLFCRLTASTAAGGRSKMIKGTSWVSRENARIPYSLGDAVFDELAMRTLITGIYPQGISDLVIKRKENIVNVTFYVYQHVYPSLLYFLKGFSECLLSHWHGLKVNVDARYAPNSLPPKTLKKAYRLGQTWDGLSKSIHIKE